MVKQRKFRLSVLACLVCALGVACSLTLDFEECATDADCAAIAGPNEVLRCDPQNFCVAAAEAPNNEVNNLPNNTPNNDDPDAGGDDPDAEANNEVCCTTSQCVADNGDNFICNPTSCACVNALSAECFAVEGPIDQDNALIIGSILPTRGANGTRGVPRERAIQMAVAEFNQNGGLGSGRRLVHVGCDDNGDSEQGRRAADHLVNVVGVQAIVGPAFSSVFTDVSDQVTSQNGVLIISPSATSAGITNLDDNGLSWRTVPSDSFQGIAIADRVRDLAAELNHPARVAAFGKDGAYGSGLLNRVSAELLGDLGEENFSGTIYDPEEVTTPVFRTINAFGQADFVLLFGTNEVVPIIETYEQKSLDDGLTPPKYILSDGGQSVDLLDFIAANPEMVDRIEGVAPDGRNGDLYETFNLRFRNRYGEDAASFTANAYDATYIIAYAASSLPNDELITGAALAGAIERLVDGSPVESGPDNIGAARNILLSGNTIDFEGASGSLQFDLQTGDVAANMVLWRVGLDVRDEFEFQEVQLYRINEDGRTGQWGELE